MVLPYYPGPNPDGFSPSAVCRLRQEVAIEDFDDGSLALLCEQLRLVSLNCSARQVVSRLDGRRDAGQVAAELAAAYDQPFQRVLPDVLELLATLEAQGVVERID